MNNKRLTNHERTEALAYSIYLQENKPPGHAQDHWLRAEAALSRLNEPTGISSAGAAAPDHLRRATLQCTDHSAIRGLAVIYRESPEDGGKFFPASLQGAHPSLQLPATLHLDDSAETFHLDRLQPSNDGGASFDISFSE